MPRTDNSYKQNTRYLDIAEALQADILSGKLRQGVQLPTQRELARQLEVTQGTVNRAYAELARRGLVFGHVGRGSFVLGLDGRQGSRALATRPGELIDMAANKPAGELQVAELRRALLELSKSTQLHELLAYQPDAGPWRHREAASAWLQEFGIDAQADRIAITVGAQEANAAALLCLTRPGDAILVEEYTYTGMKSLAATLSRKLEPVEMDAHGLVPKALAHAVKRTGARVLYTMPSAHNPTTTTMPAARRKEIVEIARKHDLAVIEDGVYEFLSEEGLPTLSSLAPERTFYVTSLSKSIAPGVRFGIIATPEGQLAAVAAQTRGLLWMPPPLMGELASRWIESGKAREMVRAQRNECASRMTIARNVLEGLDYAWQPHAAHVWLKLPTSWGSNEFVAAMRRAGVAIAPTDAFSASTNGDGTHVRIGLASPASPYELTVGLKRIAEVLQMRHFDTPLLVT